MFNSTVLGFAKEMNNILPAVIRGFLRQMANELTRGKITIPQYLTLDLIYNHGPRKMSWLAKEMSVSLPAMSGLISRLYRLGFIKRIYDDRDRRVIRIDLAHKGRSALEKIRSQRQQAIARVFGKISQRERQEYLRILTKIYYILTR
jgi:DNA-binding MarR family transcriptional regulator